MITRSTRFIIGTVALMALSGCDPAAGYDHLQLSKRAGSDGASVLDGQGGLVVPRGGVLVFEARVVSDADDGALQGWETLTLRSGEGGGRRRARDHR